MFEKFSVHERSIIQWVEIENDLNLLTMKVMIITEYDEAYKVPVLLMGILQRLQLDMTEVSVI